MHQNATTKKRLSKQNVAKVPCFIDILEKWPNREPEAELPHPVDSCIFHIVLHFGSTYLGFQKHKWTIVSTSKIHWKRVQKQDVKARLKFNFPLSFHHHLMFLNNNYILGMKNVWQTAQGFEWWRERASHQSDKLQGIDAFFSS